jgi:hypothetical protein
MERLIAIFIAIGLTFFLAHILCPLIFFFVEEIVGRSFFAMLLQLALTGTSIVLTFIGILKLGEKILVKKN